MVIGIDSYDSMTKRLELREKLLEITEQRINGIHGIPTKEISSKLQERIQEKKWSTRLKPAHQLTRF